MIGIYALWFEEPSMIYIGQSQSINQRYSEHIRKLKNNKHTNYKVQNCYDLYGKPELIVLEECLLAELNDLEIQWTEEYDSLNTGLNIIEAGQVGYGPNSNGSRYSKITILRVFSLLYRTKLKQKEIVRKIKVNISLIEDIKQGNSHLWLREKWPDKYQKMKRRVNFKYSGELISFITPEGILHTTNNINNFAKEYCRNNKNISYNTFATGLYRLKAKTRKQYKGWKLYID